MAASRISAPVSACPTSTDHISLPFPTPWCVAETPALPSPWLEKRCLACHVPSSWLTCTRFGKVSHHHHHKSVALLTSSMLPLVPGKLSVLVASARLRSSDSVMKTTCLGSASRSSTNGQPFMVYPNRTIRFNSVNAFKSPSSPPNTPRTLTINASFISFASHCRSFSSTNITKWSPSSPW